MSKLLPYVIKKGRVYEAYNNQGELIDTYPTQLAAQLATQKWAEEDNHKRKIERSKRND